MTVSSINTSPCSRQVADAVTGRIERRHEAPGHNLRGLSLSPDGQEVYFSHQRLDSRGWADRDAVLWGILMANSLRGVPVSKLLGPQLDFANDSWVETLGLVGDGAGDPDNTTHDA